MRARSFCTWSMLAAVVVGCGGGEDADAGMDGRVPPGMDASTDRDAAGRDAAALDAPVVDCTGLTAPTLDRARIALAPGMDEYPVALEWSGGGDDAIIAEVAPSVGGEYAPAMAATAASSGGGEARLDKTLPDLYLRLVAVRGATCRAEAPAVRLAKPDYRDPATWGDDWIRVVSHTHSIADIKTDLGEPVHTNRINWFNGCFDELGDDAACHELLLRSSSESGVQWLMDAAADNDIDAVIVTDHDNVGIWFTDTFRRYDRADPSGPSVIRGLEWTSALGHLTVVGNFLPEIDPSSDITDLDVARRVHTSTPLPPDTCDDTDENHDVNEPVFDGPDAPCTRADHRGHGDDPISIAEAMESIAELRRRGALVFANHPTQDAFGIEPTMAWQLENLDLLDGSEVNTPDPTATNRNAPEWWRDNGLRQGRRWVGIAGTDCHVNGPPYDGSTGCNSFHGLTDLTHMDAPFMFVRPLSSTSHAAVNAPELVVAALREGRVAVVQDLDPAVVVDLGIDVNDDGLIDYWSGSTVPACEQPGRDTFTVQVRVRPVQTHNYNVQLWHRDQETRILDRTEIVAGETWVGEMDFSRSTDIAAGSDHGFVAAWVREDRTLSTDDDAGFSNPIYFEAATATEACDTRDADGL